MDKGGFKIHFKCYNCGHQWYHMVEKGVRYYDTERHGASFLCEDLGISVPLEDLAKSGRRVVCPWCYTFSDIKNITSGWAPSKGYRGVNICIEEDNPVKIAENKKAKEEEEKKAKEEKEKQEKKVIEMEKEKEK